MFPNMANSFGHPIADELDHLWKTTKILGDLNNNPVDKALVESIGSFQRFEGIKEKITEKWKLLTKRTEHVLKKWDLKFKFLIFP